MAMDAYLESIKTAQRQIDTLEAKKITAIGNNDERTRLPMMIPGISYVTAMTAISEIVHIKRFPTAEKPV